MFRKFKFEESLYQKLQSIPLSTQYKLDRVGILISLKTWRLFSEEERRVLCHLAVRSQGEQECYRDYLVYLLRGIKEEITFADPQVISREKNQWENLARVPEPVYLMGLSLKAMIAPVDWIKLDDLERYALLKLSLSKHDQNNLEKALLEFLGQTFIKPPKMADAS